MKQKSPETNHEERELRADVANARAQYLRSFSAAVRGLKLTKKIFRKSLYKWAELNPKHPLAEPVLVSRRAYDAALTRLVTFTERSLGVQEARVLKVKEAVERITEERRALLMESVAMRKVAQLVLKAFETKFGKVVGKGIKFAGEHKGFVFGGVGLVAVVGALAFPAWFLGVAAGLGVRYVVKSFGEDQESAQVERYASKDLSTETAAENIMRLRFATSISGWVAGITSGITAKVWLTDFFKDMGIAHAAPVIIPLEHHEAPSPRAHDPFAYASNDLHRPVEPVLSDGALPLPDQVPQLRAEAVELREWADRLINEYQWVMDLRNDQRNVEVLSKLKHARASIDAFIADADAGHDSELMRATNLYKKLIDSGTEPKRIEAMLHIIAEKTGVTEIPNAIHDLQAAYQELVLIQEGKASIAGVIQPIDSLYGPEFKHVGQTNFKPRTGRAFIELVRDMLGNGETGAHGVRITEGGDGLNLTSEHGEKAGSMFSETGSHYDGTAFDWAPQDRVYTKEYIYRVLMLSRQSPYYGIIFEPGSLFESNELRAYVASRMVEDTPGLSYTDAMKFVDEHIGNSSKTTGTHFHAFAHAKLSVDITPPPSQMHGAIIATN